MKTQDIDFYKYTPNMYCRVFSLFIVFWLTIGNTGTVLFAANINAQINAQSNANANANAKSNANFNASFNAQSNANVNLQVQINNNKNTNIQSLNKNLKSYTSTLLSATTSINDTQKSAGEYRNNEFSNLDNVYLISKTDNNSSNSKTKNLLVDAKQNKDIYIEPTPKEKLLNQDNTATIAKELEDNMGNVYALAINNNGIQHTIFIKNEGGRIILVSDEESYANKGKILSLRKELQSTHNFLSTENQESTRIALLNYKLDNYILVNKNHQLKLKMLTDLLKTVYHETKKDTPKPNNFLKKHKVSIIRKLIPSINIIRFFGFDFNGIYKSVQHHNIKEYIFQAIYPLFKPFIKETFFINFNKKIKIKSSNSPDLDLASQKIKNLKAKYLSSKNKKNSKKLDLYNFDIN